MLLITSRVVEIREDILKQDGLLQWMMLGLNRYAQRELEKRMRDWKKKKRKQTMGRWHLRKADLSWPMRGSAVSQWSRVKRGMKACEWVSAGVRVPCIPWAANLPVSPLSPPTSWCCLKGCCVGCREPTTTHWQTEWVWDSPDESTFSTKLSLTLSFWHNAPNVNSAGSNFKKRKNSTAYKFKEQCFAGKQFDVSHNLYCFPHHSTLTSAVPHCVQINLLEVVLI